MRILSPKEENLRQELYTEGLNDQDVMRLPSDKPNASFYGLTEEGKKTFLKSFSNHHKNTLAVE